MPNSLWYLPQLLVLFSKTEVIFSASSLNFNEYIDIFPSTYFVKIFFDDIVSENLGPSRTPLTLLKRNQFQRKHDKAWCKFFPTHQTFIGSRSENTLNLVFINITDCCSSRSIGECKILDFVKGDIYDGRKKPRLCSVQPDLMYTLVLTEYRERELILNNFPRLRAGLGSGILPDYYLVIDQGNNKGFPKTVCNYVYPEDRVLLLHCINSYNIFDTLVKKHPSSNQKVWKTDMEIDFSPNHFPNPTDLWKFYFDIDEDQVFITAALQKSNESAQSYNGYTICLHNETI
jgi:hypothetical protein